MPFPVSGGASAIYEAVNKATASIGPDSAPKASDGAPSFADMLGKMTSESEASLHVAERSAFASASDNIDIADLVTTLNDAEGKLRTIVTVRDRLVSSLQEIFRMPV